MNVDPASGDKYYTNEQTGESQWDLPQQEYGQASLPAGWITDIDPASGTTYYINERTGEAQWEPPLQQVGRAQQDDALDGLPAGWTTAVDPGSGNVYYTNEQTGESQWEPPQQGHQAKIVWNVTSATGTFPWVDKRWTDTPRFAGKYGLVTGEQAVLGRWDVDAKKETRPWVSRQQCVVQIAEDVRADWIQTRVQTWPGKLARAWLVHTGSTLTGKRPKPPIVRTKHYPLCRHNTLAAEPWRPWDSLTVGSCHIPDFASPNLFC